MKKTLWAKLNLDIFLVYSWVSTVFFFLMDIFPHPLRYVIFKILLGKMGKKVVIDYKTYIRYPNTIELGDNVVINRGCEFYTSVNLGKKIKIGNNVKISPNTKFYGAAHDHTLTSMPNIADDILVEDNCWICADCTILQGVSIGHHSVVGAGSVVTKDIPPYSVAVGNPAKVIK